jgi:hypothetical protein
MCGQEGLKMLVGCGDVPGIGALHCQAVTGERIARFGGDEFFQDLAARLLLWLGCSHAHSIFALGRNAKYLRERELSDETIFSPEEIETSTGKIVARPASSRFAHGND